MKRYSFTFFFLTFFVSISLNNLFASQRSQVITGRVLDATTGVPLEGVNIVYGSAGTTTNAEGSFSLTLSGEDSVLFSHIAYRPKKVAVDILSAAPVVELQPHPVWGATINVSADRAIPGITPVAFSTLSRTEIQQNYVLEDVPMVLRREPGIYAYSESGSGTGYSYVSIRGFDQSRISVMIDGVPLNDNESHEVYWVDHGDILSGASDVQIQRGIGNTLYGASAFGGAINVQTRVHHAESGGSFSLGGGSYNTLKGRLEVFSGPSWKPGWEIAARYSGIISDGYRVDSRSKQHALFLGINRNAGRWQHAFLSLTHI